MLSFGKDDVRQDLELLNDCGVSVGRSLLTGVLKL